MDGNKIRLDLYVSKIKHISRKESALLIDNQLVKVNNKVITKKNHLICEGKDSIEIGELLLDKTQDSKSNQLIPWESDLTVVYEDQYLFIVNKDSGIIVHPTSFNEQNTLANQILFYVNKNNINTEFKNDIRLGICHRLDKDTSGLIIVAKQKKAYDLILDMFAKQEIKKTYLCLLHGTLETINICVDAPIKRIDGSNKREVSQDYDAKDAFTSFKLINSYKGFCLAEAEIKTGRTHQIRVHAKYIKHWIINDPLYGKSKNTTKYGQYLVANCLSFIHPITNDRVHVDINQPKEFTNYISKYGG